MNWTAAGVETSALRGVRALTAAEIGVVFQPIVDLATGKAFAHEALVRCKRPEYQAPPVLFDAAVKEGACGHLGRIIREVTFATSGDIPLFVNLHPEELSARWLVRPDDPVGFHTQPVFLEITESAAFTHFEVCVEVLRELALRTGSRLAIDDFGSGHSNLERLVNLEPAIVKLDLALTRDVHTHPRKQAVVRHMVNLCAELGAQVVAEGVEHVEELRCVRDLGVQYAQGYLLARPAAPPPPPNWPLGGSDPGHGKPRKMSELPPTRAAVPLPAGPSKRPPRNSQHPGRESKAALRTTQRSVSRSTAPGKNSPSTRRSSAG
jgi:EAL domain-containing protein (putative c-di-GMP-specific phosphodiesterase class I)